MNNAFSVFSLKRNRSTSTTHTKANSCSEPVSKLSKLKSGFSIFSKITNVISLQHSKDTNYEQKKSKRASWIDLLQYFRSDNDSNGRRRSRLRRKATYDSDSYYEYHNYYKKNAQQIERNTHTSPTPHTKKLTSILIKQSGSSPQQQQQQPSQPQLIKISSRVSNTHTSVSNITVNSEDLTAKEFADIAGIRILSETEDDPIDEERKVFGSNSSNFIGFTEDVNLRTVSTGKSFLDDEQYSILSCISAQDIKPKIWDTDFWKNPENTHHQVSQSHSTTVKSINNKQQQSVKSTHVVTVEPPILHELRRMSTRNNDNKLDSSLPQHYVIKKGRFEIQLGDIDSSLSNMTTSTNDSTDQQIDGVLEWKRKKK